MKLENIKVAMAYESATNPRGKDFEGNAFDDLVASVKEKGVLVPVIARPNKKGDKQFEIVAGNRRFRAAKTVGLKEIPARVEEMTDEQAREVQIIENLQREDVHPIEEGKSYRQLMEKSKYDIATIAAKVGKSESYIKQRLYLTNLTDKSAKFYRTGKMTDGHAVLIARLSENDQTAAIKFIADEWDMPTVKDLKGWIDDTFYNQLENQPWLNSKEENAAVGPCKECQPNRNSLFGEVKDGACTDLKCWNRKMTKYVDYKISQNPELVKVCKEYGMPDNKDVLSLSNYEMLSTNKKKQCDSAKQGIVAEGKDRGTIIYICADPKCKTHGSQVTPYAKSPEEKEQRKKEQEKALKEKGKEDKKLLAVLDNIKYPVTEHGLDVLLELVLKKYRQETLRDVAKRHKWEPVKDECDMGDGKISMRSNWGKTVRQQVSISLAYEQKFRLIIEIMLEEIWEKKEIIKLIEKGV